ncbi:uncharacterized protein LOC144638633 isoform X1 [Oculina patagonica]
MANIRNSTWHQKSQTDYMKNLLSTIITLSILGMIVYWKSFTLDVQHNYRQHFSVNRLPMLNGFPSSYKQNSNQSRTCHNVLHLMRNAQWIKRGNVTPVDKIRQSLAEIQIREKRGMPIILHRSDLRCGGAPFFLTSPNFDYHLPALCDVNGSAPCCNHVTKMCGIDCNCDRCTDFRKEISAELFDWTPLNGCTFTNFTSQEACGVMSDKISRLVLIGDSLVRHLFNALMILFTNNPESGSLSTSFDRNLSRISRGDHDREMKRCRGVMQFVDGGTTSCHTKTLTSIPHEKQGAFCGGQYKFDFFFKEYYNIDKATDILATVRRNLNKDKTVIAIGVGLHMNLNAEIVQKKIIEPVLEMKKSSGARWPYILWISIHAHGSLKDTNYNIPSHNDRIARFNSDMENYLSTFGIPVFDTFNLTNGVRSIDGTHFGCGVNMMKGQLFMNFLHEAF